MNGKFLLDTNIVIAHFSKDPEVEKRLAESREVFVPSIVIGELCYGARKSAHIEENLTRINEFATSTTVLPCNTKTAKEYGYIKNLLRTKGLPIPENDIWIAAIALQHQLILVSRDEHFKSVEGLSLEIW